MHDFNESIKSAFSTMSPLVRYVAMLELASTIAEELPKAEEEFNKASREKTERFLKLLEDLGL